MRNFQIIILGVFIFFAVVAVLVFSGVFGRGGGGGGEEATVVIWGTFPERALKEQLAFAKERDRIAAEIEYVEKRESNFREQLIEALASGAGPDLVILPHQFILSDRDKFLAVSFEVLSERTLRDNFIDAAEILLAPEGVLALPLLADPLVMYWNKSLFAGAGLALPPDSWDEFLTLPANLTVTDRSGNIIQSTVALGGFDNINHAKEILSALILQTGDRIAVGLPQPEVVLGQVSGGAESALRFYTEFSNPVKKQVYSWNSSLANSLEVFASERLAVYFGLASDLSLLRAKNPNLNFDVKVLPQISGLRTRLSWSRLHSVALLKTSRNPQAAWSVGQALAFGSFAQSLAGSVNLPPARRDLLAARVGDPSAAVFREAALIGRAWFDPAPRESREIFRDMVSTVVIGKVTAGQAVARAAGELEKVIK